MPPASHHPPLPQPPPRHALESTPRTPTPSCSAAPHLLQATPASQLKTQDASSSCSKICTSSVYSGVRRGFIHLAYLPPACPRRGTGVRTSYPHPAGMAWLVAATVLAVVVSVARADAGHFFAETPKHLPRIGRRGDLPPLTTLLSEEDARSSGAGTRSMTEALAGLDSDGDGCIGVGELLRIPAVRVALLLQNPALLTPANPASPEADGHATEDTFASDRRPEPRLLRYLQK
ncbi:hypothetical protein O3P69_017065 [Scylla paramamosain]|uniref:EF-hand domain-containing protein n=1 Tax=Scylla paramamosain TaxID=85552 RepID=A0AAW0TVH8_SCYPA